MTYASLAPDSAARRFSVELAVPARSWRADVLLEYDELGGAGEPRELQFVSRPRFITSPAVLVRVANNGKLPHSFKFCTARGVSERELVYRRDTKLLAPGATTTLTVTFPGSGNSSTSPAPPGRPSGNEGVRDRQTGRHVPGLRRIDRFERRDVRPRRQAQASGTRWSLGARWTSEWYGARTRSPGRSAGATSAGPRRRSSASSSSATIAACTRGRGGS